MADYSIREAYFDNEAWVGADLAAKFGDGSEWSGDNQYLGQTKNYDLIKLGWDYYKQPVQFGFNSGFHSKIDGSNNFTIDPNSNKRAKFHIKGTEFKIWWDFDGVEDIEPPVPAGDNELKIVCKAPVDTREGLFFQAHVAEDGKNINDFEFDTSTEGTDDVVGMTPGKAYHVHIVSFYNLSPPEDIPAYVEAYWDGDIDSTRNCTVTIVELDNIGTKLVVNADYS
jgi:hypothetical protein